jgi:hypothetical protein
MFSFFLYTGYRSQDLFGVEKIKLKESLINGTAYIPKQKKTTVQRSIIFDDRTKADLLEWVNTLPETAKYVWGSDSFQDNCLHVLRNLLSDSFEKSLNASSFHNFRRTRLC